MAPEIQITMDEHGDFLLKASSQDALSLSPGTILVVEEGPQGTLRLRVQRSRPILRKKEGVWVAQVKANFLEV